MAVWTINKGDVVWVLPAARPYCGGQKRGLVVQTDDTGTFAVAFPKGGVIWMSPQEVSPVLPLFGYARRGP